MVCLLLRGKFKIQVLLLALIFSTYMFSQEKVQNIFPIADNQQLLSGMTSVVRSLDTYMTAVMDKGLVGENSQTDYDISLCSYPMIPQYFAKSSGYLSVYIKSGLPEYKTLSQQFIEKLWKINDSTVDKSGKHWSPTQVMRAKDGKYYGYTEGKHDIPYDQSKGKYLIEGSGFPDAWGAGAYELSQMASYLDEEYKQKLITILETMADFWNRDYMLYKKAGFFLYRTEDVEPSDPKPQKKEPKWGAMGSDIIYSVIALNELKQNTDKYDINLMLVFKNYCDQRVELHGEQKIDYLDSRMVLLAKYFKSKNKCEEQVKFVFNTLPNFYKKRRGNAMFMTGGATTAPSTIPLLDLYSQLGKKDKFKELWDNIWNESFGERGIKIAKGYNFTINNSAYPVLLDAGYQGWTTGILTDNEFVEAVKKYYTFKGDKRSYRDLDDWVTEVDDWDRENKGWKATPFERFGEKIEPEAFYYGLPQAYTLHRSFLMADQVEALKKENQTRNCYIQFTMPFGTHGERMRYALATTFNMLDTSKNTEAKFEKAAKEDKMELKVLYKEPKVPKGMPCFGIKDVTGLYYMERRTSIKDGYEITGVTFNGKDIAWQISHILNYKNPFEAENNAKITFLIEAEGNEKAGEVVIIAEKRKNPYYITRYDENTGYVRPCDIPFVEKQRQQSVVDDFRMFDAMEKYGKAGLLKEWSTWCLAYRSDKSKVSKDFEREIKEYVNQVKEIDESKKPDKKEIVNFIKHIAMGALPHPTQSPVCIECRRNNNE